MHAGLKVADQHGHFFMRRPYELELPSIDADKTFAVRIEHDDLLEDESKACVQIALLYTTQYGKLCRVLNVTVQRNCLVLQSKSIRATST